MKNKLMVLVLLASLNGALFAGQEQPEDVHAACKQEVVNHKHTIANYKQEIARLRDDFAEEIARRQTQDFLQRDFTMEEALHFFEVRIDGMSLTTLDGLSFKHLFMAEININNLNDRNALVFEPELKKMIFLFFLVTKNMPGIKITLEGEALQLFASFKPETRKILLQYKLVTLKNPTFYDRNAFKIKIVALISLCIFLYKYRDTFFENSVVVKEKLERLMEKLISTFKNYAAPTFVFAGVAAKEAYNYISNSNVLEPVKKYFSRN